MGRHSSLVRRELSSIWRWSERRFFVIRVRKVHDSSGNVVRWASEGKTHQSYAESERHKAIIRKFDPTGKVCEVSLSAFSIALAKQEDLSDRCLFDWLLFWLNTRPLDDSLAQPRSPLLPWNFYCRLTLLLTTCGYQLITTRSAVAQAWSSLYVVRNLTRQNWSSNIVTLKHLFS